jgi:hypothetical protein
MNPKDPNAAPSDRPNIAELAEEVVKHLTIQSQAVARTKKVIDSQESLVKAILSIATNTWRIQARLTDPISHEPYEEIGSETLKKVNRYVMGIFESLRDIGIEVKDRTGEAFDYGLPEQVVSAQAQPGLSREVVIETIRPTIYWGSETAQKGEVVIGTPPKSEEKKA